MMRSVSPLLDYYDHHGIRTTTLNRGERFCFGLTVVLFVLDCMAYIPIIKSGMENFLVIRYFHRYSGCSITLSQRHGISLRLPRFLFVISFISTVLISDISVAQRCLMMSLIGSAYLTLEIVPIIKESSVVNRSISFITLSCRYKLSLFFLLQSGDLLVFTGISRTWRSACFATTITRPHQLPWLMLSETPHTHRRRFFSLLNKNRYQLPLSKALSGKRCWGSQHNWVVALGPDYRAHLMPLVKGEPIALPPLDTIRGDAPEEWFRLAHKFILFKDPSHDHELSFLVFAIFSPMNCLAFARVGQGTALNRRGQDEWVIVTGTLVRFELDAPLLPEVQVIASYQPDVREPRQLYLVESLGKLYMVFCYGYLIPSQRRHVTTYFLVYTFNFSALAFEEVRDLEGHASFVGDGNSWSIPTSTIPAITNRIYFTDDHWDWPMYLGGTYGGRDLGGFNMANRFMQSLPFGKVSPPSHSRPILATPPIRLE
ncbi:hypothetical protein SO802_017102 [Lithocarpus litseifolius]|uniref:KIB1-4 beta-propeller domain-containing protein n=1 Tax=Lithocarpus litseifolius TaxID=425828 RepID=A0AAW2D3R4_9ROSI